MRADDGYLSLKKKAPTRKKAPPPARPDRETVLRARRLYRGLVNLYPDAHCELNYRNPFELLIATILSAQCTDVRVNMVAPDLFKAYPTAADLARADAADIEELIRSTGFYRNKTKALLSASADIAENHGNAVPDTMDELLRLHGVARKTANVVLGNAFAKHEGVAVDTHVIRLSNRMGLTRHKTAEKIERDLMALFPQKNWGMVSHLLIWHGRRVCDARKPDCEHCALRKDCPRSGLET